MFAYARQLADTKRRHPADDVVSLLVAANELSPQNFNTLFLLLVIAGNETTRHALNHGALALAERPDELARLRADPGLLTTAVEEVLRYASPQIHFRRTAVADTTIAGVPVAAGDKVVTWYLSANYDEEVFADPYTLNLGRDPNRHVTFGGGGPHFLPGVVAGPPGGARVPGGVAGEEPAPGGVRGGHAGALQFHQRPEEVAAAARCRLRPVIDPSGGRQPDPPAGVLE